MKQKGMIWVGLLVLMFLLLPATGSAEGLNSLTIECNGTVVENNAVITSDFGEFAFEFLPETEIKQIYRTTFSGTNEAGEVVEQYGGFYGNDGNFMYISIYMPGTYGPFTLNIQSGSEMMEYTITLVVSEEVVNTDNYGSMGFFEEYHYDWRSFIEMKDDKEVSEEESAELVNIYSPSDVSMLSGAEGYLLWAYLEIKEDMETITVELRDPDTKEVIGNDGWYGDSELTAGTYGMAILVEHFEDGKEYELAAIYGEHEVVNRITLVKEVESENITVVEAPGSADAVVGSDNKLQLKLPNDFTDYSGSKVVDLIKSSLEGMTTVYPGEYGDGLQFRYIDGDEQDTVLRSFSIASPTVLVGEVKGGIWDLTYMANEALYRQYSFEFNYMDDITTSQPVNMEKFNVLTEEDWIDLDGFDFDRGYADCADGTYYYWIPVYYPDEKGGIYENTVYIFSFMVAEGMDEAFAETYSDFIILDDYRTEMTLIADQTLVMEILKEMYQVKDGNAMPAEYPELVYEDSGEDVKRLQKALWDAGYQNSSVDGYFGVQTEEAVSAYQEDMGLEVNGIADSEMQKILYASLGNANLLNDWIENKLR